MVLLRHVSLILFVFSSMSFAQTILPQTILLWPDGAPGAHGDTDSDKPALTIYTIGGDQRVPTGVLVFPGGGYVNLAIDHEGQQIAAWLNSYGISAFVLRYRLGPKYRHPVELGDAQRPSGMCVRMPQSSALIRIASEYGDFRLAGILLPRPELILTTEPRIVATQSNVRVAGPTS
jgi:hypothetical protein